MKEEIFDLSKITIDRLKNSVSGISCNKHGNFCVSYRQYLKENIVCTQCDKETKIKCFFDTCNSIHNNRYDYSNTIFRTVNDKIKIICLSHGEFEQRAEYHKTGGGCPKCAIETKSMTKEEAIEKAKIIHNDKYDYSETEYIMGNKYTVICPEHGRFLIDFKNHMNGKGCKKCFSDKQRFTTQDFIERANKIHNGEYDYSRVVYTKSKEKVEIVCKKGHVFWQRASSHFYYGKGCPTCSEESKLVTQTKLNNKISVVYNTLSEVSPSWLGNMRIDIYIPEHNIAIEYQGGQHFKPIEFYGGVESFENQRKRDEVKYELCKENNIHLLYFTYTKSDVPKDWHHKVYTKESELLEAIETIIKEKGTYF